ncbi:MAG TPA: hypothetical protein VLG10_08605 [Methylomirabilota bacterium]|nr:hypothetical protein [Methylomirabilota bacterium]
MAELTRRYVVLSLATPAPFDPRDPDALFVLKPWKDPAALRALRAYRDNCYPELARDLNGWIRLVEAGPVIRGDVGRRNERHLQPRTTGRRPAARRPSARRPAARPKRRTR